MGSKEIEDGGPAFAAGVACESGGWTQEGMTLRQWYAGQALSGLVEMHHGIGVDPIAVSRAALQYADALIAAEKERS